MTEQGKAVEGFYVTGAEVQAIENKAFQIGAEPHYEELGDEKNRKLIVPIIMGEVKLDWVANKTSQKTIIAKRGRILKDWVGYKGEFIVEDQKVGKDMKAVIYVK